MEELLLVRVLTVGMTGTDVYGAKRALHRYLGTGQLAELEAQSRAVREKYRLETQGLCRQAQRKLGLPADGILGPATEHALREAGAFDDYSDSLLREYADTHLRPRVVYPHLEGVRSTTCQEVHQTDGLDGYWALDFCCPGGSVVLAVMDCEVFKLSGHDPSTGTWANGRPDSRGSVFGWSVYYATASGLRFYTTHYGSRKVKVGQKLRCGDVVGRVGGWPNDPGRSHTHLACYSPHGKDDAVAVLRAVENAERVPGW